MKQITIMHEKNFLAKIKDDQMFPLKEKSTKKSQEENNDLCDHM